MRKAKIINETKNMILIENCMIADSFFSRLIGLMGKKTLQTDQGMCISPCKSIHTFFMRFDIDVIFVDNNYKVIKVIKGLKPWKISPYIKPAKYIIELSSRTINEESSGNNIEVDDKLNIIYK